MPFYLIQRGLSALSLSLSPSRTHSHTHSFCCRSVSVSLPFRRLILFYTFSICVVCVRVAYNIFEKWFFNLFHRAHSFVSIQYMFLPKKHTYTNSKKKKIIMKKVEKDWDRWRMRKSERVRVGKMKELFNTTYEKCADWVCDMIMLRVPSIESRKFGSFVHVY